MSLIATGAYLKRLREEAKLSRLALSKQVGTSDSQIIRIEGGQETRASLLALIVKALNASPDDVIDLLSSSDYNQDDGLKRAELWIDRRKPKIGVSQHIPQATIDVITQLTDFELGRLTAFGERMIEERTRSR